MRTIYTLLAGLVLGSSALARGPASPSPSAPLCTDRDGCVDAIRIDEVYFATEATGTELETHPWVELVNTREVSVQLGLFSLADASGNTTALPSVWLPPGARLVVVSAVGVDALDFSDGQGTAYASALSLDRSRGAVGLYGPATIVDFVSWHDPYEGALFLPGPTQDDAVEAGIWPAEGFFATQRFDPTTRAFFLQDGSSMARDGSSTDTDDPADLDSNGDAQSPTPGEQNTTPPPTLEQVPGVVPQAATWLVMLYLAADNDLSGDITQNLDDIETALEAIEKQIATRTPGVTRPDVNFVVLLDQAGENNSVRGHLGPDGAADRIALLGATDLGEVDTADPQVLDDFVTWATNTYPHERSALILSGHGDGWKGLADDETSEHMMTLPELGTALEGHHMDVIAFDMCQMGAMVVAYEIRSHATYMMGSQLLMHEHGFAYGELVKNFTGIGDDPLDFTATLLDGLERKYFGMQRGIHLSTVALADMEALAQTLSAFGTAMGAVQATRTPTRGVGLDSTGSDLLSPTDNVQTRFEAALLAANAASDGGGSQDFVDLYDLLEQVSQDTAFPADVVALANRAKAQILEAVKGSWSGPADANFIGLNIYAPLSQGDPVTEVRPDAWCDDGLCTGQDCCEPEGFDGPGAFASFRSQIPVKYAPDGNPDCQGDAMNTPRPNASLDFTAATTWDEMLHRYYEPVAAASCPPLAFQGAVVTCDGSGSSDADNAPHHYSWDVLPLVDTDNEDWDDDCQVEANDDLDYDGETVTFPVTIPGVFPIVLTVEDDFSTRHAGRWEQDQDETVIQVLPADRFITQDIYEDEVSTTIEIENISDTAVYGLSVSDLWSPGELTLVDLAAWIDDAPAPITLETAAAEDGLIYLIEEPLWSGQRVTLDLTYAVHADVDGDGAVEWTTQFDAEGVASGTHVLYTPRPVDFDLGGRGRF